VQHTTAHYSERFHHVYCLGRHCNTLQRTATYCNTLQRTIPSCSLPRYCNTLQRTTAHCNIQFRRVHCPKVLQHTAMHRKILQHTIVSCLLPRYCNNHTVAPCSILKPTATQCNTLQHTASTSSGDGSIVIMLQCVAMSCTVFCKVR